MSSKLDINVLDMEKEFSLTGTKSARIDGEGYFRGVLDSIELIEVDYTENIAVNFNTDRTVDQGKKIQLDFKFKIFTEYEDKPISKSIRTGTTFSKQVINQKYKSRGNKIMKSVFNKFTDLCLALGFVQPYQLQEQDSLLLKRVEGIIKVYNTRKDDEKVLIAGRYIQGEEKLIIDWLNMVYVEKIDYENANIAERIESLKIQKNQNLPNKTIDSSVKKTSKPVNDKPIVKNDVGTA
jgi:hypothetical protein